MYTFIVNANSRSGLGREIWEKIETRLQTESIPYEVFFTKPHRHTEELVRTLTSDHALHTLVIVGGDGTVNEVINGIVHPETVTLGYIPTGSGNDFGRSYHFPQDPLQALELILSPPHIQEIDIGEVLYKEKNRRFLVSSGFGFDAAICHEVVVSPWKPVLNRLRLGKLVYVFVALHQWIHLKPRKATLILDQTETHTFEQCYFIASMNHPYEGGGFMFAPTANPSDGKLNVCVLANLSKLKMLFLLPTALWGKHVKFRGVFQYACQELSIHSEKAQEVHTDGEPCFLQRDLTLRCMNERIRIITPL